MSQTARARGSHLAGVCRAPRCAETPTTASRFSASLITGRQAARILRASAGSGLESVQFDRSAENLNDDALG